MQDDDMVCMHGVKARIRLWLHEHVGQQLTTECMHTSAVLERAARYTCTILQSKSTPPSGNATVATRGEQQLQPYYTISATQKS